MAKRLGSRVYILPEECLYLVAETEVIDQKIKMNVSNECRSAKKRVW